MKAAVAVGVQNQLVALFVILTASVHVAARVLGKVVFIHKVVASVVGWVGCRVLFDTP